VGRVCRLQSVIKRNKFLFRSFPQSSRWWHDHCINIDYFSAWWTRDPTSENHEQLEKHVESIYMSYLLTHLMGGLNWWSRTETQRYFYDQLHLIFMLISIDTLLHSEQVFNNIKWVLSRGIIPLYWFVYIFSTNCIYVRIHIVVYIFMSIDLFTRFSE
jgi:hypothetical protein